MTKRRPSARQRRARKERIQGIALTLLALPIFGLFGAVAGLALR